MLRLTTTSRFRKDLKRSQKRTKDLDKLEEVVRLLRSRASLPTVYRDHSLSGTYAGHRELHIESDWLLVYIVSGDLLKLVRTGTHADLFD